MFCAVKVELLFWTDSGLTLEEGNGIQNKFVGIIKGPFFFYCKELTPHAALSQPLRLACEVDSGTWTAAGL